MSEIKPTTLSNKLQTSTNNETRESSSNMRIELPTKRIQAPDFPAGFSWVNTDRPLRLDQELKGHVVVLDFWTYCCINCMHILPDLEYIEQKYAGQPVAVIGVHSAKFDNEADNSNILTACQRYRIAHPVIVDQNHRIWSAYGVHAWPTLVVLDPEGKIVGSLSGEGNRDILYATVYSLLEEGREKGTLAPEPVTVNPQAKVPSFSGLSFPGKVLVDADGKYLFISDSNHDRVIISDLKGEVIAIAGSGRKGLQDGAFDEAEFSNPQGLAYAASEDILYVADTDNHCIRKLDLKSHTVETISGTGQQGWDRRGGSAGTSQTLNSPWDLALDGNRLLIAMAGSHQIWTLDLQTGIAQSWAGSGREDIFDGPASQSALAQPSGLTIKDGWLYFADSEVSAVRRAELAGGNVETLIGTGLFDFGDRDGSFGRALLQHPLGVAASGDAIYVADTYNHKIKRLDEETRTVETVFGSGGTDLSAENPDTPALYEPGGISITGEDLYIADTNHDRILRYSLKSRSWTEVKLTGLQTMEAMRMDLDNAEVREIRIKPDTDLVLKLSADFLKGIHLNGEAPIGFTFTSANGRSEESVEAVVSTPKLPVEFTIPAEKITSGGTYHTMLSIAYCTDGNSGLCVPVNLAWKLKIKEDPSGSSTIELSQPVKPVTF